MRRSQAIYYLVLVSVVSFVFALVVVSHELNSMSTF